MTGVQKAVFPGILVGIATLVMVTTLIASPTIVQADNEPNNDPALTQPAVLVDGQTPEVVTDAAVAETAEENGAAAQPAKAPTKKAKKAPQVADANQETECSLNNQFSADVLQWCDLIEKHAAENGLEPTLVAAVITQESTGNPSAYSTSGAVGLMQIMPSDGIAAGFMCVAGPCFASRPSSQELLDPDYNISYGAKMLSGLINKYGSVREALKNYGPMNVGYYYADIVLGIYNNLQ